MQFFRAFKVLRASLPFMKSIRQAYKDTLGSKGGNNDDTKKKHFFDSILQSNSIRAPPLLENTALQILNIEKSIEDVTAEEVLTRYRILFKKNDPSQGGTTYLQSKIAQAKKCLMIRFPDADKLQEEFNLKMEAEESAQVDEQQVKDQQKASEDVKNEKVRENLKKKSKDSN